MEEELICIPVMYEDQLIYWPLKEFKSNPPMGAYIIKDHRKARSEWQSTVGDST